MQKGAQSYRPSHFSCKAAHPASVGVVIGQGECCMLPLPLPLPTHPPSPGQMRVGDRADSTRARQPARVRRARRNHGGTRKETAVTCGGAPSRSCAYPSGSPVVSGCSCTTMRRAMSILNRRFAFFLCGVFPRARALSMQGLAHAARLGRPGTATSPYDAERWPAQAGLGPCFRPSKEGLGMGQMVVLRTGRLPLGGRPPQRPLAIST